MDGIRPSPAHIEAVRRIRMPTNPSEMKSLVGLFTYFCHHFSDFSARVAQLNELAKPSKNFPSPLPRRARLEIERFKAEMMTAPLLQTFDPRKDLYIDSDASLVAAGACVYHLGPKGERRPPVPTSPRRFRLVRQSGPPTCGRPMP